MPSKEKSGLPVVTQLSQALREPVRELKRLRSSGVAFPTPLRFTGLFLVGAGTALSVSRVSITPVTLIS